MRARRQVSFFLFITLFLLALAVVQSTAGHAVAADRPVRTWGDPAFTCADPRRNLEPKNEHARESSG